MRPATFLRPCALAPLLMSLVALTIVIGHIALVGTVREADEGASAHLFQLLIAAQAPIIAYGVIGSLRHTPRQALIVLCAQMLAIGIALTPVWYFGL